MELTPQQKYLLDLLATLAPFESITITADKDGKPDRFMVRRSQTISVTEIDIRAVKSPSSLHF